jgi:hypothetical protein
MRKTAAGTQSKPNKWGKLNSYRHEARRHFRKKREGNT